MQWIKKYWSIKNYSSHHLSESLPFSFFFLFFSSLFFFSVYPRPSGSLGQCTYRFRFIKALIRFAPVSQISDMFWHLIHRYVSDGRHFYCCIRYPSFKMSATTLGRMTYCLRLDHIIIIIIITKSRWQLAFTWSSLSLSLSKCIILRPRLVL